MSKLLVSILFLLNLVCPTNVSSMEQTQCLYVSEDAGASDFPLSITSLKVVRHINSGGGAFVLSDDQGKHYILKYDWDLGHYKEEMLANALYKALGVRVPKFAIYTTPPEDEQLKDILPAVGLFQLSEFIPGQTLYEHNKQQVEVNLSHIGDYIPVVANHFVADALMSNWDITNLKNIVIELGTGIPVRVDNGGSLRYRATGDKKSTSTWNPKEVGELQSLRNRSYNKNGAHLYADLNHDTIIKQIAAILEQEEKFFATFEKVTNLLQIEDAGRLEEDLRSRFSHLKDMLTRRQL